MDTKLNLFGDRISIIPVDESFEGKIEMPQTREKVHDLGQVIAVGNGKVNGSDKLREIFVKEGDLVLFQTNAMMVFNATTVIEGKSVLTLHQGDLIARLTSTVVKLENFNVIGKWILVEPFSPRTSVIVTPENAPSAMLEERFKVTQRGNAVRDEIKVGDELILERSRCNRFDLNGEKFAYISDDSVYGVVLSQV